MGIIKQNGIEYIVKYGTLKGWNGKSEFKKPIYQDGKIVEGLDSQLEITNLKISKIEQLKENANQKFQKNQWYYDREVKLAKAKKTIKEVPQAIIDEDGALYDLIDLKELEILALTTYDELLAYDITL